MRTLILAAWVSLVASGCASPVAASDPSVGRVTLAPTAVVLAADQAEITLDIAELI